MDSRSVRKIAVVMPVRHWYFQTILHGIADYSASHGPWLTYISELGDIAATDIAAHVPINGVIFSAGFDALMRNACQALKRWKLPLIAVASDPTGLADALVDSDDDAVGRLAAEAFLPRGYTRFAFYGVPFEYAQRRKRGFVATLEQAGRQCAVYQGPEHAWGHFSETWEKSPLTQWLKALPKPVALFADNDLRARQALYACRLAGIHVPEEVAVIGVDNETAVCDLTTPPLSSIPLDLRRVGYEAASLLDRIISGRAPPAKPILVPPLPLVQRRSSDFLAIDDPDLIHAVRFIWDRASQDIGVEDILAHVPISRRTMEMAFKKHLGRTPQQEIWRVRVERAKVMLSRGRRSMEDISRACGFSSASRLQVVFKRETGLTPTAFRKAQKVV